MKLKKGLVIEGRKVIPTYLKVKKINKESDSSSILIGIKEGRNHIVKKIFASMHHDVKKLKRETIFPKIKKADTNLLFHCNNHDNVRIDSHFLLHLKEK